MYGEGCIGFVCRLQLLGDDFLISVLLLSCLYSIDLLVYFGNSRKSYSYQC